MRRVPRLVVAACYGYDALLCIVAVVVVWMSILHIVAVVDVVVDSLLGNGCWMDQNRPLAIC